MVNRIKEHTISKHEQHLPKPIHQIKKPSPPKLNKRDMLKGNTVKSAKVNGSANTHKTAQATSNSEVKEGGISK